MPATDVRRLDDEAVARKLEALEYRTPFPALSGGALRIVEHPAVTRFEVASWLRG